MSPKSKPGSRRDLSSDEDSSHSSFTENTTRSQSHIDFYTNETHLYSYNSKSKLKPKPTFLSLMYFKKQFISFQTNFKLNPYQTTKKVALKLLFYIWCVVVVLSILSLLGFPITKLLSFSSNDVSSVDTSGPTSNKQLNYNYEASSRRLSSFLSFFEGGSDEDDIDGPKATEVVNNEEEEIPQQILPVAPKQGNKLNKKLEKELACEEQTCIAECNEKAKPKCLKSLSCKKDRDKLCRRRCRKQRCEDRCKDEPKFGYVEREQRMEKCKDDCTGPTLVHNKCIKKCHSMFKPCKSRCHEIASKFICDAPKVPLVVNLDSTDDEDEAEDGGGTDNFSDDFEDDQDDPETDNDAESDSVDKIIATAKKTYNLNMNVETTDLIEDPEII